MSATQVWERLYAGSIFDAEGLVESNPEGINTVITLSPEAVSEVVSGASHLHLPVLGNRSTPVGIFDELIDALWENIRWGTVFVHSFDGVNRAPIAWMHVVGCKNIDAALAEIATLRTIEPNPTLLSSIKELL